jgi:predicted nucleotidyltransferase
MVSDAINWPSLGNTMSLAELRARKMEIHSLAHQFGARRIRVFGSTARNEDRPDSDIDFLVDFPPGYDLFSQRIPLTECLSTLLHRPVDLIPEHEINRHIRDAVLREAVEL